MAPVAEESVPPPSEGEEPAPESELVDQVRRELQARVERLQALLERLEGGEPGASGSG